MRKPWKACAFIMSTIARTAAVLACCLLLMGCRSVRTAVLPQVREVSAVRHDTCTLRDSIYVHDSIRVVMVGDTVREIVFRTTFRDRWKTATKTDTLIRRDTVTVAVPVEKARSLWALPGRNILFLTVAAALVLLFVWPPAGGGRRLKKDS